MPPTMRAHCGACAGLMVLCRDYRAIYWIYWYVCRTCGTETPTRLSVAEADCDVVWVPVTTPVTQTGE